MICPQCKAELPDNAAFCPDCGASLAADAARPAAQPAPAQPQYAPPQPLYAATAPMNAPNAPDPRRVGSPLFLAALITLGIGLICDFIAIGLSISSAMEYGLSGSQITYYVLSFMTECLCLGVMVAATLTFIKSKKKAEPLPVGDALSIVRAMIIVLLAWEFAFPVIRIIACIASGGDVTSMLSVASFYYRPLLRGALYLFAILSVCAIKKAGTNPMLIVTSVLCFVIAAVDLVDEARYYAEVGEYLEAGDLIYELPYTFDIVFSSVSLVFFGILLLKYNAAARAARR